MFEVIEQRFDKHVVIPDTHGEHDKVKKIIDAYYNDESVGFVFLGDIIDRKGVTDDPEQGVRRTLDSIKCLGSRAIVVMANHEWMLLGSCTARDKQTKDAIAASWLVPQYSKTSVEASTVASYDLTNTGIDTAARLWREMRLHGHAAVLTTATPYYETDGFIAIHAGITDTDWDEQKDYLEAVARDMSEGVFWEQPDQWFSIERAIDAQEYIHRGKTVVSGHAHYLVPSGRYKKRVPHFSEDRILHGGGRVRLASQVNPPQDEPLLLWQDWDGVIKSTEDMC